MAGLASKRQRDEAQIEEMNEAGEELKRQKSYNQILSLLDEDEEEPIEDLSSIITTLQQEISSPSPNQNDNNNNIGQPTTTDSASVQDYTNFTSTSTSTSSSSVTSPNSNSMKELEEEGERDRVMRHLLQASDDELGIPNAEFLVADGVALCDALWELEDEAANYYTLFQSQLFM